MKTTYHPAFEATLTRCGLDPSRWRSLVRSCWRLSTPSRKTRQFIRQVQRVHSGKHAWIGGQWV